MKHTSIRLDMPCEFINITPLNPLISKCEIKVCYVGDEPNRNKSIITKEVARQMANSLPGSPIVGYYNESKDDFEEHNRIIEISGGKFKIKDTTKPYGFVDLGARVWFQKFLDDGVNEREYMMTEGYLWTGQYPEAQRIIDEGNNQSMELDQKFLDATWSKDINGKPKFFIINEAIISKLCILGEEEEPCFEGSTITEPTIQFSLDDGFKEQLFSMMNELKNLIKEGGTPVFNTFAVEIGDALWSALYSYLEATFPRDLEEGETECLRSSKYWIESIWEDGTQKFAILRDRKDSKLYRLNFSWTEAGLTSDAALVEVEKTYVPVSETPVFSMEEVEKFEEERYKLSDNSDEIITPKIEKKVEGVKEETFAVKEEEEKDEEVCPECGKPKDECECEKEKKKENKYSLEEIPEYVELLNNYTNIEKELETLKADYAALQEKVVPLENFKLEAERNSKKAMIDSFYMLSDDDKKDVLDNIDTYSIDDIEAKLSVICVRNKVNFNLDEDKEDHTDKPITYSLNDGQTDSTPAWIKSLQSVAKDMK